MKGRVQATVIAAAMCLTSGLAVLATPSQHVAVVGEHGFKLADAMPERFGDWVIDPTIVPVRPSPEVQKVIAQTYSQTLERTYRNAQGYRIMLSLALGDQVHGMDIHRPEICYPAQGFPVRRDTQTTKYEPLPGAALPLRQLVAGAGPRNEPISYWLVVGDQVAGYGWRHRLATLKYGLTGVIPDGMLVRVSSIDTDEARAFDEQQRFIHDMVAGVSPEFRKRLLGAL